MTQGLDASFEDEVGYPRGKHARFTAPGSREDEEWACAVGRGLELQFVEPFEVWHLVPSLSEKGVILIDFTVAFNCLLARVRLL